jgi:CBS domain containing-hemolysin-like protein
MKNLTLHTLDQLDHLVQPEEFDELSPDSPAMQLLTDFKYHRPHMVEAHMSAVEAVALMQQENVRVKLVVDEERECVGVVDREDLSEQRILLNHMARGIGRNELQVRDLMQPRHQVYALDLEDLHCALVKDLVATLQREGQRYCLVVDHKEHLIRGLLSTAEIALRLRNPIPAPHSTKVTDMVSAR